MSAYVPHAAGYRTLRPNEKAREGDIFEYIGRETTRTERDPLGMSPVKDSGFIRIGRTVAQARKEYEAFWAKYPDSAPDLVGWVFRLLPAKPRKKKACSYAKKYKAKRKPTCGCSSCADKWRAHQRRLRQASGQLVTQGGKIQLLRVALP
jgi:hypothetical protein